MNEKIRIGRFSRKSLYRIILNKILCYLAMLPIGSKYRILLYSFAGVKFGKNCFIGAYVLIDDQFPELVTCEDNVKIAYRATFITHDDSRDIVSAITLRKNSFIGTGAIILPGVIIGENSVIGAGTVITKDTEDNSIVVGSSNRILLSGRTIRQKDYNQNE
ncbi:MAG: acyltransferase [Candidatus Methanoperedens sp.]|nr:acyltransferase [Candidatus Methanoperedens sp.]